MRPAGCVEAVFTNNTQTTETVFDVGVVNLDFDGYGFKIRRLASTSMAINADVNLPLSQVDPVALRHFALSGVPGTNYGTVTLQVDPAVGPVRIKVLPADVVHAGLDDAANQTVTDANGHAMVDFTYGGPTQGLVVWQDARDVPAGGSGHFQVTVRATQRGPDLAPLDDRRAGTRRWCRRTARRARRPSTPLPATLVGNAAATYVNVQFRNQDAGMATFFDSMTYLDGVGLLGEQITQLGGFSNRDPQLPVRADGAGRPSHHVDVPGRDGRRHRGQRDQQHHGRAVRVVAAACWPAARPSTRAAPPDPTGGFAAVMAWSAEPAWFNCDGLRTPGAGALGRQRAVGGGRGAAGRRERRRPAPAREDRLDAAGLPHPQRRLGLGAGGVRLRARQLPGDDAAAVRRRGARHQPAPRSYRVQTVASSWLANQPAGTYGPFSLAATGVIALHEVWLPAGPLTAHPAQPERRRHRLGPDLASRPAAVPRQVGLDRHRRPGLDRRRRRRRDDAGRSCRRPATTAWRSGRPAPPTPRRPASTS